MPQNGEICSKFGIYRSLCCGAEIVIAAGAAFPDCPKHPRLTTKWKPLNTDEDIPHISELFPEKNKKKDPAA